MKPRVLVLSEYYLPGYRAGGTVRSVSNLVDQLSDDFDWFVAARDRDLGADSPYEDIAIDAWTRVGSASVLYASPGMLKAGKLLGLIRATEHDLLYLNSFFSPHFSVLPQWARRMGLTPRRPVLLAPRGEFSPGALALKAPKKRLYLKVARAAGTYRDTIWHASTELEANHVVDALGVPRENVRIARNLGVRLRTQPSARGPDHARSRPHVLRLCFLARLTRNKNLSFALKALAHVRHPVEFTVYGPKEDAAYWAECEELRSRLPAHVEVNWKGAIPHEQVVERLAGHDLFFLPSAGENFGHVLVEAWIAGLPVLISDRTPWRDLESRAIGWDFSLDDPARFARAIDEVTQWPEARMADVRRRCTAHGMSLARDNEAIDANRRLLLSVAHSHLQP